MKSINGIINGNQWTLMFKQKREANYYWQLRCLRRTLIVINSGTLIFSVQIKREANYCCHLIICFPTPYYA